MDSNDQLFSGLLPYVRYRAEKTARAPIFYYLR
jgi:hypothetical protein